MLTSVAILIQGPGRVGSFNLFRELERPESIFSRPPENTCSFPANYFVTEQSLGSKNLVYQSSS